MVLVMVMERVGWWEKGGKVGGCGPGHAADRERPQRRLKRLRDSADCSLHAEAAATATNSCTWKRRDRPRRQNLHGRISPVERSVQNLCWR